MRLFDSSCEITTRWHLVYSGICKANLMYGERWGCLRPNMNLGDKTILNRPSAKTVNCLLTNPPLSNIKFNKKLSKRTCHGLVEYKSCLYRAEWSHYTIDWVRLIDDILIIWKGNERSLTTFKFIEHPNGAETSFKWIPIQTYILDFSAPTTYKMDNSVPYSRGLLRLTGGFARQQTY